MTPLPQRRGSKSIYQGKAHGSFDHTLTSSLLRSRPLRLIVPGWFGTNSTKWLSKLSVQDKRAPGPFTTTFYNEHHPPDDPACKTRPIWAVRPNSFIAEPAPESIISGSKVSVEGWAWSCDDIEEVGISADEGKTWTSAQVDNRRQYSWQRFRASIDLRAGDHAILSRARGADGRTQPLGEGRNHVHHVHVTVT